jgi:hypothetical protein
LSESMVHWLTAAVAIASFVGMLLSQRSASSKLNGQITEKVAGHDSAITKIEQEQIRQWQSIGEHDSDIAVLKNRAGINT